MSNDDDPIPGEGDPVATGPKGGGEWPHPATPPSGAAPGTDPGRKSQIAAERDSRGTSEEGSAAELHPAYAADQSPYEDPVTGGATTTPPG